MKNLTLILLLGLGLSVNAQKDTTKTESKNYLAIEVDPAPCILGGYSFSVKYSPKKLPHFAVTTSVYGSRFPDNMMGKANYNNGFRNLKIETSYAVFTDYFIRKDRTGFYAGPSVFYYNKSVSHIDYNQSTSFNSIYVNMRAGYVYKPFKNLGLYVNPWINVGKEFINGTGNKIKDKTFKPSDISYIAALHIGYQHTF